MEFAGVKVHLAYFDATHTLQFEFDEFYMDDREADVQAAVAEIHAGAIPPVGWSIEFTDTIYPVLYALWDRDFLSECMSNGNFWYYNIGGNVVADVSPRKSWSGGK
jgi:hypothetical protein